MKALKLYLIAALVLAFAGCKDGYIDELTAVDPGPDESAPQVTINFPLSGTEIQVYETVTPVTFKFEVTDDIEVQSISLNLDGSELASFSEFKDFRRVIEEFTYETLADGDHTVTVSATDTDGKTTTKSVDFSKVPPYVKKYDGEIFYMPFDGDNIELVSVTYPTVVGAPSFAGEGKVGGNAYAGANDAYLTFPTEGLLEDEFSAVFWMKVNADPDRAGILTIGPPDEANPDAQNNRTSGFRFFRENAGGKQRFKLNVGTGGSDSWFDGGAAADVTPGTDEWVHFGITISQSQATVYINGQVVSTGAFAGVDWTNTDIISIMSGAPRFAGWNHLSDQSYMDELRMFNKSLSQSEIQGIIADEGGTVYNGEFGEVFYMPFEGDYTDQASLVAATEVGSVGFAGEGLRGNEAFLGATDSYLTFPSSSLQTQEFSASMWYKVNAAPDRAGILVIGPPDADNPTAQNVRTSGFRFFREAAGTMQRFKLNVGTGAGESWFDGGAAADVDPTTGDWIHLAFTISGTEAKVYIDGQVVSSGTFDGIDWANCDIMSIGSGAPRFTGWGHNSDLSFIDELRVFDKVLTDAEVQAIAAAQ
ncbi:concanavalin A-like lectin/glucanase superfamily protein [Roseivirga pacifica]|uniref:Concanavalin A-like lectin/glucanases superfamily protein n=1 Tax=Roseivirga pacifica TaxID=1267423 RepID=A0A1I0PYA4_9BACT|nr:LamG-like jellyroll fold domain-containing protein [Roseivirga pacifica]RKQ43424.1 concanavalin A-like lectin/glucanase superfamily protein [Roseivirga pacifica]SEW19514.1 Concanavalin A-like lectin/glucanases superfamily protein [Roseivirga pacifica]